MLLGIVLVMSDGALLILGLLEVLGLAGLFVYVRAQAKRRAAGGERPPRAVRMLVALLGLVLLVGFPLVMIFANPAVRSAGQRDALVGSGTPAVAVITHIEETGDVINRRPEVRVHVSVEPPGAPPFDSEATWPFSVTDMQTYRVGTRVKVMFDPADHATVAVVGTAAPGG